MRKSSVLSATRSAFAPGGTRASRTLTRRVDSPRVTGAYRFIVRPGKDTVITVKASVFIIQRRKPRPLGVVRDNRLCLTKVFGPKH